jgi:hypothetical protein
VFADKRRPIAFSSSSTKGIYSIHFFFSISVINSDSISRLSTSFVKFPTNTVLIEQSPPLPSPTTAAATRKLEFDKQTATNRLESVFNEPVVVVHSAHEHYECHSEPWHQSKSENTSCQHQLDSFCQGNASTTPTPTEEHKER